MRQNNTSAQKKDITHSAVTHSPACGKWTQTRRIFFPRHLNPGFQRVFKQFLRVFKVLPHSKGFQSVSKFQKLVQIFWEQIGFILVVGIRATFTCFQHLRPRNRGFLHEIGNSLDFDYLKSRQKQWYTYIPTYMHTNLHTSESLK